MDNLQHIENLQTDTLPFILCIPMFAQHWPDFVNFIFGILGKIASICQVRILCIYLSFYGFPIHRRNGN